MTWTRPPIPTREQKLEAMSASNWSTAKSVRDGPKSRAISGGGTAGAAPKENPVRSKKLRQSAKGENCLMRIPGCPGDPLQTIWSHYRGSAGGKGGGIKASDICGCYACTYCDAVYDGQRPRPDGMTKEQVDLAWLEGHVRSLVRLQQKGLLCA